MATLRQWLPEAQKTLASVGIATARLDCLILLEDVVRKDRAWLLAHLEHELPHTQVQQLNRYIRRRSQHEPLAYIRGKTEFYGREFKVSKHTLEPRPESETMIEQVKQHVRSVQPLVLADVGTGSGALAITIKLELPDLEVHATEISKPALAIAKQNAQDHHVKIGFYQGDLLTPLPLQPNIIIANLPYVPNRFTINPAAMQEPKIAIFGGRDGLDIYRQMFQQIAKNSQKPQLVITESLPPQHAGLQEIARHVGYDMVTRDDFIQAFSLTG